MNAEQLIDLRFQLVQSQMDLKAFHEALGEIYEHKILNGNEKTSKRDSGNPQNTISKNEVRCIIAALYVDRVTTLKEVH